MHSTLPQRNFLHYQDHLPRALHIEFHGHNFEKKICPIERNDKNFVDNFNQRYENKVTIPKMLIPIYDANLRCKHGSKFKKEDRQCILISDDITLYRDHHDVHVASQNYY